MQLLTYTSGDVSEALDWMNQLDRQYELTNQEYGMGDFIEELKDKGYITENEQKTEIKITPKTEQGIRGANETEVFRQELAEQAAQPRLERGLDFFRGD